MSNGRSPQISPNELLNHIDQDLRREFESNRRVLSFDEYVLLLSEQPDKQTRGSARYVADMMDSFGHEKAREGDRFKLFDLPADGLARKVVGQEAVQNQIYRTLRTFTRQGINSKLVLLHGPNGSAKTSTIHALMGGMERYSNSTDGALYTLNWVFPMERYTKGGIGINQYGASPNRDRPLNYAKLPDEEIAARIPCDMKDHPILMIPRAHRKQFLTELLGAKKAESLWPTLPQYIAGGELCHRCRQIFDALLTSNNGDFKKVLAHVQVERFYFSRRYRHGLVTIEPQMHVDAQYQQLSYNRNLGALPPALQAINFFALGGDLVEGNRGIIEFSDLLKRPVDTFKYLLTACETGAVNVGSSIAYLDAVMLGSTNEIQLDAFKEFPDFISFKARIELIRVPYLLSVTAEEEIYTSLLEQFVGDKHITPHVAWALSLWAVLTRLKKPNSINYAPSVSTLVANLTPVEKARFYDTEEMPGHLSAEDRKLLKSSLRSIEDEYSNIPYYEGRLGASAREMKSILFEAAQNPEFPCLSPLAVLRELENFVKRVTEYEFLNRPLRLDPVGGLPQEVRAKRLDRASQGEGQKRDHRQARGPRLRAHRRARENRRSADRRGIKRGFPPKRHLADRGLVARPSQGARGLRQGFPRLLAQARAALLRIQEVSLDQDARRFIALRSVRTRQRRQRRGNEARPAHHPEHERKTRLLRALRQGSHHFPHANALLITRVSQQGAGNRPGGLPDITA
jgi:predicted Ser/Thr protein kinase